MHGVAELYIYNIVSTLESISVDYVDSCGFVGTILTMWTLWRTIFVSKPTKMPTTLKPT